MVYMLDLNVSKTTKNEIFTVETILIPSINYFSDSEFLNRTSQHIELQNKIS